MVRQDEAAVDEYVRTRFGVEPVGPLGPVEADPAARDARVEAIRGSENSRPMSPGAVATIVLSAASGHQPSDTASRAHTRPASLIASR